MAWALHAPTFTYRDHTLSNEVRREAIPDALTMQFLKREGQFGKGKGDTYTMTRILRLPLAARIAEMDQLPDGRPALVTKNVSISRWGFKIPITEMEEDLTKYNLPNEFKASLREQITLTMDVMAAGALKQTPWKYVPTAAGFDFATTGTAGATSDRNFGIQDLRTLWDTMRTGNGGAAAPVPPMKDGSYNLIGSTRLMRGIKNDPEYKDWMAPSTSGPIKDGKLPEKVEGFRLFESNHDAAWSDLAGASTTTGEGVAFGTDAAGYLDVRTPDIRMSIPVPDDLGTVRWIGWVGIMEAFLTWETATLARAVHITSL
jgi:N4-gp56 family major capsid protein